MSLLSMSGLAKANDYIYFVCFRHSWLYLNILKKNMYIYNFVSKLSIFLDYCNLFVMGDSQTLTQE